MKILYSFNGTGYGHASRAMSILPILKHYDVDILVSGEMNPIDIGHQIEYRFKGFTFAYNNGKLDDQIIDEIYKPYLITVCEYNTRIDFDI